MHAAPPHPLLPQLQRENANFLQIPSYFVYMSRAFSTLEGIGLASDEDYAILAECYPYLAKRLFSGVTDVCV